MGELTANYISGFSCDKRNCEATIEGEEMPLHEGSEFYGTRALASGWTIWASRTCRFYCPQHGPNQNHNMTQVLAWG